MFPKPGSRFADHVLLLIVAAVLYFPGLGRPSLWDIDEGNNAEAAREMLQRHDWVVPQFNYELRVDKPALLYWLQMCGYQVFGVNEFAARLPSALASLLAILLVYELGRLALGRSAGLISALALGSAVMFAMAGHFANPDALLNLCSLATLFLFWRDYQRGGRAWFVLAGVTSGLAVLAKGPVGLVLPSAVAGLFLLWSGDLRRLLDRRLAWGVLSFCLVALPWYAWVGYETHLEFLKGFFLVHNVERFRGTMENHRGTPFYYVLVLIVGFSPWSVFMGPTIWSSVRTVWAARRQTAETASADVTDRSRFHRFLLCWMGVYVVFFSLSGTKLPNYILPACTPLALMTGDFLDRWRRGELVLPRWVLPVCMGCLCLVGAFIIVAAVLVGGVVDAPFMRGHFIPGLEHWAVLGFLPVLGAVIAIGCLVRRHPGGVIVTVSAAAVLTVAALGEGARAAIDASKAPRPLAGLLSQQSPGEEIRVAAYDYFQPSLVFYSRREVRRLYTPKQVQDFLAIPLPAYLVLPAPSWEQLQPTMAVHARVLGRHYDLYRACEVVLVTNR